MGGVGIGENGGSGAWDRRELAVWGPIAPRNVRSCRYRQRRSGSPVSSVTGRAEGPARLTRIGRRRWLRPAARTGGHRVVEAALGELELRPGAARAGPVSYTHLTLPTN